MVEALAVERTMTDEEPAASPLCAPRRNMTAGFVAGVAQCECRGQSCGDTRE
jgi:hypothetical protein